MTEIILTSSILILLLALLRRVMRGRISPWVQYALWLLVAVRLLIPGTLFTTPVSVVGAMGELRTSIPLAETQPDGRSAEAPLDGPSATYVPQSADGPSAPFVTQRSDGPTTVFTMKPAGMVHAENILKGIWKTGIAIIGSAMVISNLVFYFRLRKRRRRLELPAAPWSGKLPVYETNGLPSPCLFGLFRPAIYLNEAAMDAEHPEHVLAHEYAHYRHGDHVCAVLRCVCLAVHWYNPLVWWAAALCRRDCELACDAAALKRLGEAESIDYGQTLLRMVSRGRAPAALLHTATTMTAGKRMMKERIALIVKQPKMNKITLPLVILLACILAACAFGGKEDTPDPDDTAGLPLAVSIGQPLSSNSHDGAYITDPAEVERLWDLYRSFEYEGTYDPTGMGGWPVSVRFLFGDQPDDDADIFFILAGHGVYTQDGQNLRLKNMDEIYNAFLLASTSDPTTPVRTDSTEDVMAQNAQSIVEMIRQGKDVSEWLPLMNYMRWDIIRQSFVHAGMDGGDGSIAAIEACMGEIEGYIDRQLTSMTAAEYLYILSATEGLDGAATTSYTYLVYRLYEVNPSQFAYVVLEMLPETRRNAALDLFRSEWYYHRVSDSPDIPTREEAVAQLEADLEAGVSASPSEMTLHSASSTFRFLLVNGSGIYALTYASSDTGVAEVDGNGVVTAVGPGEAVITMHYEGAGGPLDFNCRVRCEWEVLPVEPMSSVNMDPSGPSDALRSEWQQAFAEYVFNMAYADVFPTVGLVYDDQLEYGLRDAVISSLTSYFEEQIALYPDASRNDRVNRIILETQIPDSIMSGDIFSVGYQVEFSSEQRWNGQTYQLVPQRTDHCIIGFEVMPKSEVDAETARVTPLLYNAGILSDDGAIAGKDNWNLKAVRYDILSRVNAQIQDNPDLDGYFARYVAFSDGGSDFPETIDPNGTVEIRYYLTFSDTSEMGPYSTVYTFRE